MEQVLEPAAGYQAVRYLETKHLVVWERSMLFGNFISI